MYDPLESGLYIIPSDLDYFIQFELEDQRRRKTAPPTTNPKPGRIVPDAETYYLHQRNQGALSSDDRWGLYDLVYYEQKRKIKHIRRKASWSGQPVFAIWRALGILASPHIAKVPRGVVEKLEMLRELYFSDDDDDDDEGDGDGDGGGREDMLDGEKWEFEGEVEALDLDLDIGSPEYCPSPSPAVQNEGDVDSQTTESLFQWGSKLATIQEEPSMPDQGWFL
ncbi:hypothetical protein BO78DRAFT_359359 [Aspergillus sclerotiicarbonarius CBS 121057]|uniref:Uncharacterized protein n=1 Tax=Aspergillus sclerotiicarbonarius (strain CBS 121057 / IBT 28362) TaxID=1448318 RepID=A0A319EKZ5_ASPSB|nr:hypothetical protein BO78DRAFT_359359 [Aspergillus sclerotiicarbonarius CBS 121057]